MIAQCMILSQIVAFAGAESNQVGDPVIQRMRTICGPNSLYSLLRCWGIPVVHIDVERRLPLGPRGVSLLSLKQAALHFGLQTRARYCNFESLMGLRIPAITHHYFDMKTDGSDSHFVLITSVTRDEVQFIDGTTGLLNKVTPAKFHTTWSGYVLEPVDDSPALANPIFAIGAAVGILCISKFLRVVARRGRRALAMTSAISGSLLMLIPLPMARADESAGKTGEDGTWRMSTNDSLNCIDVYFAVMSHPVPRDRIKAELGDSREQSSLLDLRRASRALGFPLRIVRPSPSDLAALPLPAIVHMVDEGGQHGGYFLLINPKKNKFETINCSSITIESMTAEEFRRRWSGFALVAEEKRLPWMQGALLGLGAFGCGSLAYRKFSTRSKRPFAARRTPT
jgi:ABC-type bacteriocin/lantibiotic exporter with double-glycine peptidase domain